MVIIFLYRVTNVVNYSHLESTLHLGYHQLFV
jgi:hypothetical protein